MLSVENLSNSFRTDEGVIARVQGVTFAVKAGRILSLVNESGSGNAISAKVLMQLQPGTAMLEESIRTTYTDKRGHYIARWSRTLIRKCST